MPELAEVEFNRKQWEPGRGRKVLAVWARDGKRVFRGESVAEIERALAGQRLLTSEAHGKQLLFGFSGGIWLGIHLGMTGRLFCAPEAFRRGPHDHLVLQQRERCLVFQDLRQFGRVRFYGGPDKPEWWTRLPPPILSRGFTVARVESALRRHARLSVKAVLLQQEHFPGVGNWMADEVLWRLGLFPGTMCGRVSPGFARRLWREVRWVSRRALATVGRAGSDPPRGWLFHHRWDAGGDCPRDGTPLQRATMGGRTTAWCPICQPQGEGR